MVKLSKPAIAASKICNRSGFHPRCLHFAVCQNCSLAMGQAVNVYEQAIVVWRLSRQYIFFD